MIKLITTTSDIRKCANLKRSLDFFGWDYHFIEHTWKGFGDKILETYKYLKAHPEVTAFFYSDAWDTFCLGTMEQALDWVTPNAGILFSSEKACYPHPNKASKYPEGRTQWKYLNGGGWFANSQLFIKMVESNMPDHSTNDQEWFTDCFLSQPVDIFLDYNCTVFQTAAFAALGELIVEGQRVKNTVTNTYPIFIHGNGHTPIDWVYDIPLKDNMMNLSTIDKVKEHWRDTQGFHKYLHENFCERVNETPILNEHRTWVEKNIWGFGERSFHWMWKLIVDEMPEGFKFLEIGVFRGQVISLVKALKMSAQVNGVTPLTNEGGHWVSDYEKDIEDIHYQFKLPLTYYIYRGLSEAPAVIAEVTANAPYDVLYIDGGHEDKHILNDITHYSPLVKPGGIMVIDDCCNSFNIPQGMFGGIGAVTNVVDKLLPPKASNPEWEFLFSIVHNRVYRRKQL